MKQREICTLGFKRSNNRFNNLSDVVQPNFKKPGGHSPSTQKTYLSNCKYENRQWWLNSVACVKFKYTFNRSQVQIPLETINFMN